jgi:hypothetical protein
MSDKKTTTLEELFAECEKSPEFRYEYLRVLRDENIVLIKQLKVATEALKEIDMLPFGDYEFDDFHLPAHNALAEIAKIGGANVSHD